MHDDFHLKQVIRLDYSHSMNQPLNTVDGRNPTPPPGDVSNLVNNGINYQPQLVSRISEPLTVVPTFRNTIHQIEHDRTICG